MQACCPTLCCNQLPNRPDRSVYCQNQRTALQQLFNHQIRLRNGCQTRHIPQVPLQIRAEPHQRQLIAEATEDLAEAGEVQDSYFEALEAAIKLLYNVALTGGFAFELFGAWQYRQHAASEYEYSAHDIAPRAHTSHTDSASAIFDPVPPNVALGNYAIARAGIWALLFLALGQNLLSWVRHRRQALAHHVPHDGQLGAAALTVELQGRALGEVRQQLSGLQLRARTSSRDVNTKLHQFQRDSEQQAGAIAALAADTAQQEQRLEDNEALLVALQAVSSKQFALLLKALPDISSRAAALPVSAVAGTRKPPFSFEDSTSSGNTPSEGALPAVSAFHNTK